MPHSFFLAGVSWAANNTIVSAAPCVHQRRIDMLWIGRVMAMHSQERTGFSAPKTQHALHNPSQALACGVDFAWRSQKIEAKYPASSINGNQITRPLFLGSLRIYDAAPQVTRLHLRR